MRSRIGSSPQARGTPLWKFSKIHGARFIPAGAGNTADSGLSASMISVHPRRRGEHANPPGCELLCLGSSPQARGTLVAGDDHFHERRFIPAGAGNTVFRVYVILYDAVHPRRRGEHFINPARQTRWRGSSPQARGTRQIGHAGAPICPVHPRRRGEHCFYHTLQLGGVGSSPQARGTLGRCARRPSAGRFIPAGAGNTLLHRLFVLRLAVHPRRRGEHPVIPSMVAFSRGSSPQARGTRAAPRGRH